MRFLLKWGHPFHWNHNVETHWNYVKENNWLIFDVESSLKFRSPPRLPCSISACHTGYSFLQVLASMRMHLDTVLLLEKMYRINSIFKCNSMCSLLHTRSVGITEKSLAASSLSPLLHQVFKYILVRSSKSLLFSRPALCFAWYDGHSCPLLIYMACHWTCFSMYMCISYWRDENWTQHFRWILPGLRQWMTSLDQLVTVLLKHLRMLLISFVARGQISTVFVVAVFYNYIED